MYEFQANNPVIITQFKWAGQWGPFRIKSHCSECDLVTTILRNMIAKEFKDTNVVFEVKPWLNSIFYCLARGVWHPPIIMINGTVFFQFSHKKPLFDRGKIVTTVETIRAQQANLKKAENEVKR